MICSGVGTLRMQRRGFMEKEASFELKKDKFQYEVREFVPVIRKNRRGKGFRVITAVLAALVICLLGAGLYRHFIYREKLTPQEACERAFAECASHIFGRTSYLIEDIDGAEWYDLISAGRYDVDATIRLKSLADFGLGFEEMIGGAGIRTETSVDSREKKLRGSLDVTWTIITVPLIEYQADSDKIVLSSPDFFDESIVIDKRNSILFDRTIGGIYEEISGEKMQESAYADMEIGEILSLAEFSCEYSALEETKEFVVCGREETCYGYKIEAVSELFVNPVECILYVDRDYHLVSLDIAYAYETPDGIKTGLDFSFAFSGEEHPADRIKGSISLYAGEDKIEGGFETETKVSENRIDTELTGNLSIPGIDYTADITFGYDKEKNTFEIDAEMSDGVDIVNILAGGDIQNDTNLGTLKVNMDKLSFAYSGREIFTAAIKLNFAKPDSEAESFTVEVPEPSLNLFEMKKEDYEYLYEQVLERIEYYKGLLDDFL